MSSCTIQRLDRPGLSYVRIAGTIDESFPIRELVSNINRDAIINLSRVSRYSSFGVRQWMNALSELRARVQHCVLVDCSPAVVNQLNLVAEFSRGCHVKSVRLPFACTRCGTDATVTVDLDAQRDDLLQGRLPARTCVSCSQAMVFDDDAGSYFAFLRETSAPEVGSQLASAIARFELAAPELGEPEPAAPPVPPPVPTPALPAPSADEAATELAIRVPTSLKGLSSPDEPPVAPRPSGGASARGAAPPRSSPPVAASRPSAPGPGKAAPASAESLTPWETPPPAATPIAPRTAAARGGAAERHAGASGGAQDEVTKPAIIVADSFFHAEPKPALLRRFLIGGAVACSIVGIGLAVTLASRRPAAEPAVKVAATAARHGVSADALLELNGLIAREQFSDAEALLRRLAPEVEDESLIKMSDLVRVEKKNAVERHRARARVASSDKRHFEAAYELTQALEVVGADDSLEEALVRAYVDGGDCPGAAHVAETRPGHAVKSPASDRIAAMVKACKPVATAAVAPPPVSAPAAAPAPGATAAARPATGGPSAKPVPEEPPLSTNDIKHAVLSRRDALLSCMPLKQGSGTLDMSWTVLPSGKISDLTCSPAPACRTDFGACMRGKLTGLEFPAAAGRKNQPVKFPFKY